MEEETKKGKFVFKKQIKPQTFIYLSLILSISIWVMSLLFSIKASIYYHSTLCCQKAIIQNQLITVIRNGGNLNDVKDVYRKRVLKNLSVIKSFDEEDYYNENVPLSEVLSDLRIKYFLEKEQRRYSRKTYVIKDSISVDADSLYFSLLNRIIDEYNKKNPFDKLEPNQRDILNNIQQKLDTGYVKISGDVSKIVDEMYNKNQLVTKYLDKSDTSFRISIIALIVTIALSFYQIYQNRKTSKKHDKRLDVIERMINYKE